MNRAQVPLVGQPATVIFEQQNMNEKDIAVILEPLENVEQQLRNGLASGNV